MIASLLSRINIEVWKDIPEYEGLYQVSNLGNVRSLNYRRTGKCKNLIQTINNKYKRKNVTMRKNSISYTKKPYILVAETFLNHNPCGHKIVVDHIDNNSLNDKLYNLQLITQRKNTVKNKNLGTSKYTGVYWNKDNKKWRATIYVNKKNINLGYFTDEKEAAKAYQNELNKIK